MAGGRLWTDYELDLLIEAVESGRKRGVYTALAAEIDRTPAACRVKAQKLGIRLFPMGEPWTGREDRIAEAGKKRSLLETARRLGRKLTAVYFRRCMLARRARS